MKKKIKNEISESKQSSIPRLPKIKEIKQNLDINESREMNPKKMKRYSSAKPKKLRTDLSKKDLKK